MNTTSNGTKSVKGRPKSDLQLLLGRQSFIKA